MKLLLLGATGETGRWTMRRAIDSGDTVTVLVRRPEALTDVDRTVRIIQGDATSVDDIRAAAEDQDAVISALGRGMSFRAHGLFSSAAPAVTRGMTLAGVQRLVWLSSFGVGDTFAAASLLQKAMYATFLRDIYADKARSEVTLRSSGLDLTLVYPTTLTDGPASGSYRVGDRLRMRGAPSISRRDVAHFLHRAASDPSWIGRDAVLSA